MVASLAALAFVTALMVAFLTLDTAWLTFCTAAAPPLIVLTAFIAPYKRLDCFLARFVRFLVRFIIILYTYFKT
jgi:hypothetical protein